VVGFPDLWLTGWIGRSWGKRDQPLEVWGPEGIQQMMEYLPKAFAVDIQVRSKSYLPNGVRLVAREINEGVLFDRGGIKVTAFEVDHGRVRTGSPIKTFGNDIFAKNLINVFGLYGGNSRRRRFKYALRQL